MTVPRPSRSALPVRLSPSATSGARSRIRAEFSPSGSMGYKHPQIAAEQPA